MKRWTWLALLALVSLLTIGYSVYARRPAVLEDDADEAELGVESYDEQSTGASVDGVMGGDSGDSAVDMTPNAADSVQVDEAAPAPEPR